MKNLAEWVISVFLLIFFSVVGTTFYQSFTTVEPVVENVVAPSKPQTHTHLDWNRNIEAFDNQTEA